MNQWWHGMVTVIHGSVLIFVIPHPIELGLKSLRRYYILPMYQNIFLIRLNLVKFREPKKWLLNSKIRCTMFAWIGKRTVHSAAIAQEKMLLALNVPCMHQTFLHCTHTNLTLCTYKTFRLRSVQSNWSLVRMLEVYFFIIFLIIFSCFLVLVLRLYFSSCISFQTFVIFCQTWFSLSLFSLMALTVVHCLIVDMKARPRQPLQIK